MSQGRTDGQVLTAKDTDTFSAKQRNLRQALITHTTNPTTAPYVLQSYDDLVRLDVSGGTVGLTLPQLPQQGEVHEFFNIANSANGVTVTSGALAGNIIGTGLTAGVTQTFTGAYKSVKFTYVGTVWVAQAI